MLRVLLVEDNPGDVRLIREMLKSAPGALFELSVAENLATSITLARSGGFDAILLDMSLPDSMGLPGLQALAVAAPRTPILVLTGINDDTLALQTSRHGAQDYLVKDEIEASQLARAIRYAIERKTFEAILTTQAHFDSLTGLINRSFFNDRLAQALLRAGRARERVAVMFIDLDKFKAVNDTLGHQTGDELLRAVADLLRHSVRQSDTVARLGGDEFTILIEQMRDVSYAGLVATKILTAFQTPLALAKTSVQITPSIGIAIFPDHASEAMALLNLADAAMFRAKASGANVFEFHDPSAK